MRYVSCCALLIGLLFSAVSWAQTPIAVEDTLSEVTLPDAHGNAYQVPYPGLRHLLFSDDMDGNELMEQAFGDLDKGEFTAAGLAYAADISGMPSLIARFFAVPSLRDYPFRVLLARDKSTLAHIPREEGHVTVLTLTTDGTVSQIRFVKRLDELTALLPSR
ncbi:MAG: FAD/FMN-containing dehydrogenase [Pseudomonadota bacterium]